MKIFIALTFVLFSCSISYSQVGVNTAEPTSTLDVNGSLRVRSMSLSEGVEARQLVGVDENGNFIEVEAGQNIEINNNVIESNQRTYTIERGLDLFEGASLNNLIVFPGGGASGKRIITIRTLLPMTLLTGIVAAPDGTSIILYPIDGDLNILPLNAASLPANQIQTNDDLVIEQFQTAEFFYDGSIQKWVRM